jgi:hypothetical protein
VRIEAAQAQQACDICNHAQMHGSWPPGFKGTHCATSLRSGVIGCHRSWTSLAQVHCVTCHGQFATNGVADLHWCDSRRDHKGRAGVHLDPATVKDSTGKPKLYLGPDDVWSTSSTRDPEVKRRKAQIARETRRGKNRSVTHGEGGQRHVPNVAGPSVAPERSTEAAP